MCDSPSYLRQELYADVTEIFKELTEQKKRRLEH